ncbi:MAG: NADH-quinone oxidoreductase subunit N [Anaerolineales bacterium]|nr:NADH-quinone oxidoreductase subunit N [Anaerolineales bacterium]MCX7754057.1 NADH-quinone oxidoreductase subunit N [Anaerolineales bacterium]MDW8276737.1 NADH-quinone oxidoreductase subunit N [Anaerolineales bacterium]
MTITDFSVILPVTLLTAWASILLLAELFLPRAQRPFLALLAALGLALTLGISLAQSAQEFAPGFGGMVVRDGFSNFLNVLFLLTGLFGVALSYRYNQRAQIERGEYYPLLLFSVAGMMLMGQAADLIVVFLALELLSFPLYILSAFAYPRPQSEEAGLKYFLLGAFASGFVVYGIALTFGASGSTDLARIVASVAAGSANLPLLTAGAGLLLVGFGFKVAAVPFHMWTPDVYQGAPTSVTAFMAAGAKTAGFAALLRVFGAAFPALAADLSPLMAILAAVTMLFGNLIAVAQTDMKRMLAYSSIAQAGYLLMAFAPFEIEAARTMAVAGALFYLLAYTLASFGSWGVVIALEKDLDRHLSIGDFAGLARRSPWLAAAMTVFMLSLTGLPPTLGLVGKIYLFRAVIEGGMVWLAVIGALTSVVSAFYYLRIVVNMFMREGEPAVEREWWLEFAIGAAAVVTVVVSLWPFPLFEWAEWAVMKLF